MRGAAAAVILLMASLAAGCASQQGAPPPADANREALRALVFPPLFVKPTPGEPFETPGNSSLQWANGMFAVESRDPAAGVPRFNVLKGTTLYSTSNQLGWRAQEYPGDLTASYHLSPILAMWDLPSLAVDPDVDIRVEQQGPVSNYTITGVVERGNRFIPISLKLAASEGQVIWGHLVAEDIAESPFTFFPGPPVSFPVAVPERFLDYAQIRDNDKEAAVRHAQIASLVTNYTRNHGGQVPPSVDPDTLALELLTSGKPWPKNVYTGEPMRDEQASGDFIWCRTDGNKGRYTGFGWDSMLTNRSYGTGQPTGC